MDSNNFQGQTTGRRIFIRQVMLCPPKGISASGGITGWRAVTFLCQILGCRRAASC